MERGVRAQILLAIRSRPWSRVGHTSPIRLYLCFWLGPDVAELPVPRPEDGRINRNQLGQNHQSQSLCRHTFRAWKSVVGSLADERGNPHFAATSTRAQEERLGVLNLVCTWNRINLKAAWTCGLARPRDKVHIITRFSRRKDISARDAVADDREKGKQSWARKRLYCRTKGFLQFGRLSSVVTELLCHFINNEESPCSFTWSA